MKKHTTKLLLTALLLALSGCGPMPEEFTADNPRLNASDYISISDYMGLETGTVLKEVTEDEINTELDNFIKGQGGFYKEDESAAAKEGDKVNITYVLEGEESSPQNTDMIIGQETIAKELDDAVTGAKKGDEVRATSKDGGLSYKITVNSVFVSSDPTNEFIKSLEIEDTDGKALDSVKLLKEDIRKFLESKHIQEYNSEVEEKVKEYILENAKVTDVPDELAKSFASDISEKVKDLKDARKAQGEEDPSDVDVLTDFMNEDSYVGTTDDYIKWKADKNATEYLAYLFIAQTEGIEVTRDEELSLAANDWITMIDRYPTLLDFVNERGSFAYEASALSQKVLKYVSENTKEGLLPVEEDHPDAAENADDETTGTDNNDNNNTQGG